MGTGGWARIRLQPPSSAHGLSTALCPLPPCPGQRLPWGPPPVTRAQELTVLCPRLFFFIPCSCFGVHLPASQASHSHFWPLIQGLPHPIVLQPPPSGLHGPSCALSDGPCGSSTAALTPPCRLLSRLLWHHLRVALSLLRWLLVMLLCLTLLFVTAA